MPRTPGCPPNQTPRADPGPGWIQQLPVGLSGAPALLLQPCFPFQPERHRGPAQGQGLPAAQQGVGDSVSRGPRQCTTGGGWTDVPRPRPGCAGALQAWGPARLLSQGPQPVQKAPCNQGCPRPPTPGARNAADGGSSRPVPTGVRTLSPPCSPDSQLGNTRSVTLHCSAMAGGGPLWAVQGQRHNLLETGARSRT